MSNLSARALDEDDEREEFVFALENEKVSRQAAPDY